MAAATKDYQTLIPASIKFDFGGKELTLSDAQLSLKFTNGSGYDECMSNEGKKNYVLRRGTTVEQDGDITITLIKTPDKEQIADINAIQDNLAAIRKSPDPSSYKKSIIVNLYGPGGANDDFLSLKFEGYISELTTQAPELTNFMEYVAKVEIFNPETIKLEAKK
jgi:protoporphyrinogen oxidase